MSEDALTIIAIAFEAGVPAALLWIYFRDNRFQSRLIVILGAITPMLLFYAAIIGVYLFDQNAPASKFSFAVVWMMSFFVYVLSLVAGALLSLLPWPSRMSFRFLAGFLVAPMTCAVVLLLEKKLLW